MYHWEERPVLNHLNHYKTERESYYHILVLVLVLRTISKSCVIIIISPSSQTLA